MASLRAGRPGLAVSWLIVDSAPMPDGREGRTRATGRCGGLEKWVRQLGCSRGPPCRTGSAYAASPSIRCQCSTARDECGIGGRAAELGGSGERGGYLEPAGLIGALAERRSRKPVSHALTAARVTPYAARLDSARRARKIERPGRGAAKSRTPALRL